MQYVVWHAVFAVYRLSRRSIDKQTNIVIIRRMWYTTTWVYAKTAVPLSSEKRAVSWRFWYATLRLLKSALYLLCRGSQGVAHCTTHRCCSNSLQLSIWWHRRTQSWTSRASMRRTRPSRQPFSRWARCRRQPNRRTGSPTIAPPSRDQW